MYTPVQAAGSPQANRTSVVSPTWSVNLLIQEKAHRLHRLLNSLKIRPLNVLLMANRH